MKETQLNSKVTNIRISLFKGQGKGKAPLCNKIRVLKNDNSTRVYGVITEVQLANVHMQLINVSNNGLVQDVHYTFFENYIGRVKGCRQEEDNNCFLLPRSLHYLLFCAQSFPTFSPRVKETYLENFSFFPPTKNAFIFCVCIRQLQPTAELYTMTPGVCTKNARLLLGGEKKTRDKGMWCRGYIST